MADLTELAVGITLVRGPGSDLAIRLETHDGRAVTMMLGAAECVGLACELLAEARIRCGRRDWPPAISESPVRHEPIEGAPVAPGHRDAPPAPPQPRWRYPVHSRKRAVD